MCVEINDSCSDQVIADFINSIDTVLTDCDGVLWLGNEAIPGSPELINKFRDMGKKIFYVTNNSTKHRETYFKKCEMLKFGGTHDEILGTAYMVAWYLKKHDFKGKVYLIGSHEGIGQELNDVGIEYSGPGPDIVPDGMKYEELPFHIAKELEPDIKCVVAGFDFHFSYPKLFKALNYLNNSDCLFLATNTDERFPLKANLTLPGTGTMVQTIQTGALRDPIILGKPYRFMYDVIKDRYPSISPQRTLMIGDRANTDILLGKNCGLKTLMVGSGVHSLEEIRRWEKSTLPSERKLVANYYVNKLGDLLPLIKRVSHLLK